MDKWLTPEELAHQNWPVGSRFVTMSTKEGTEPHFCFLRVDTEHTLKAVSAVTLEQIALHPDGREYQHKLVWKP